LRKKLAERRKKYALLVNEVHKPKPDRFKIVELERAKEKLAVPIRPKVYPEGFKITKRALHKSNPAPSPAKSAPRPRPEPKDYIQEFRNKRLSKESRTP